MKRIFYLIGLYIIGFSMNINAQDIFFPEIEPLLTPESKAQLEKAVNILLKARGNENNANDIERKYARLKKKETTWMQKTWEAKLQRIMAENNYKSAYETISSVYSDLITNGKYKSAAEKEEAISLDNEAKEKFEESNGLLEKLPEQTKESMEQVPNSQIEETLSSAHALKLSGIGQQIIALQKIAGVKAEETISKSDDDLAWEEAKKANTIDAYYNYLNNNPRGRHMHDANELINKIEKESSTGDLAVTNTDNGVDNKDISISTDNGNKSNSNKNNKNNANNSNKSDKTKNKDNTNKSNFVPTGNLVFKVQVAAAISEISDWMLNAKVPGNKKIDKVKSGIWFKYFVGEFNTYNEAADYRDELRSHAPDAFIVVFSNGTQTSITPAMKN